MAYREQVEMDWKQGFLRVLSRAFALAKKTSKKSLQSFLWQVFSHPRSLREEGSEEDPAERDQRW